MQNLQFIIFLTLEKIGREWQKEQYMSDSVCTYYSHFRKQLNYNDTVKYLKQLGRAKKKIKNGKQQNVDWNLQTSHNQINNICIKYINNTYDMERNQDTDICSTIHVKIAHKTFF